MKGLVSFLTEGNISNSERKYREFCQMCLGYNCNAEEVEVRKTTKNNWGVYKNGRRIFTASCNILDNQVVELYGINLYND